MGVDFDSDLGKLQRLMAESIAGTTRRNAILNELQIQAGNTIIDVGCGAGHLLTHLAKAVGDSGTIYGLDPSKLKHKACLQPCLQPRTVDRGPRTGVTGALSLSDLDFIEGGGAKDSRACVSDRRFT